MECPLKSTGARSLAHAHFGACTDSLLCTTLLETLVKMILEVMKQLSSCKESPEKLLGSASAWLHLSVVIRQLLFSIRCLTLGFISCTHLSCRSAVDPHLTMQYFPDILTSISLVRRVYEKLSVQTVIFPSRVTCHYSSHGSDVKSVRRTDEGRHVG